MVIASGPGSFGTGSSCFCFYFYFYLLLSSISARGLPPSHAWMQTSTYAPPKFFTHEEYDAIVTDTRVKLTLVSVAE
jgi:hypothetical protein